MSREVPGHFEVRQEEDRLAAPTLAKVAALSIVVGIVGVFFSALLLETSTDGIRGNQAGAGPPRAGASEISHIHQTPIWGAAQGLEMRARERKELSRYGWVDRDAGVATIPVERAMDLVEQRAR